MTLLGPHDVSPDAAVELGRLPLLYAAKNGNEGS